MVEAAQKLLRVFLKLRMIRLSLLIDVPDRCRYSKHVTSDGKNLAL